MTDICNGQTYVQKTRADILTSMYVVTVEYGIFPHMFHLEIWFFQFINGINLMWDYVLWNILDVLVWIGLWKFLRIYRVSPYPLKWYCWGFVYMWQEFTMIYMILPNKYLSLSLRNKYYSPSYVSLAA